ncbi:inner membrane ABC transporter permease protein YcjP [Lachnospiraceae bacterium]|nr:carbohydrate ABC transporter permease [Lachnospiraceae bacterium]GFI68654.1 inner membrane ABC transporter permease protein YcjP [Lachnospiraceae bacterium]
MNKKWSKAINNILTYGACLAGSFFVLIPVLWMISTSLKTEPETFAIPPRWIPETVTLASYKAMWVDYPFLYYFRNSIIVTLTAVVISISISCLTGYGVTRFRFRGKESFLGFVLLTQMFPSVMLLVPYYKVLNTYGLSNTLIGLSLVYISFTVPFCSWMMVGYFKTIPLELDEAAIIDGCSRWQAFVKITLPVVIPGVASSAIYAFVTCWNEYMFANLLMADGKLKTVSVGIAELNGYYKIMWNDLMASSVVASIPLVIGFIFLQKYFIGGLTAGAVKS